MSRFEVDTLDEYAFGLIADQVVHGRGNYDESYQRDVTERLIREGQAIGRTTIIRVVRDGEIGGHQIAVMHRHDVFIDPVAQGV